jgi:hypothetical protein
MEHTLKNKINDILNFSDISGQTENKGEQRKYETKHKTVVARTWGKYNEISKWKCPGCGAQNTYDPLYLEHSCWNCNLIVNVAFKMFKGKNY